MRIDTNDFSDTRNGKMDTLIPIWVRAFDMLLKLNSARKSVQFAHMNSAAIPLEEISTPDDCDVSHNFRTQVREKL